MSNVAIEPQVSRKRIRELARAHDRAWSKRARLLRDTNEIFVPCEELNQRVDAPLLALLEEGVPENQWVIASRRECMIVEREGSHLVFRQAARKAVEASPEGGAPKTIVQLSSLRKRERYRDAVLATKRLASLLGMLALALVVVAALGVWITGSQFVLGAGFWSLIASMIALIVYMMARVSVPVDDEPVAARQHGNGWPGGGPDTG